MAQFGIKQKSRRKAGMGGFHAEYLNDRTAARQRKQMGYLRSIFSALSLLFGGLMIYIGLHYIPAFVQPAKVLKFASSGSLQSGQTSLDRKSPFGSVIGPYIDMFNMDRSYMQAGQGVDVRYNLPPGAKMDISIRQCRRLWVIEIFRCQIMSEQVIRVNGTAGTQSFTLPQTGFYYFAEDVRLPNPNDDFRVIWQRN